MNEEICDDGKCSFGDLCFMVTPVYPYEPNLCLIKSYYKVFQCLECGIFNYIKLDGLHG